MLLKMSSNWIQKVNITFEWSNELTLDAILEILLITSPLYMSPFSSLPSNKSVYFYTKTKNANL